MHAKEAATAHNIIMDYHWIKHIVIGKSPVAWLIIWRIVVCVLSSQWNLAH